LKRNILEPKKRIKKGKNSPSNIHFSQAVLSDDSSDQSYTEAKLETLYSKSRDYQKNLRKATKKTKNNEKLMGSLLNLVQIDLIKK